ncbi:hypothetical protein ASPZODRAFT_18801 [Penicilliopsis zonata CBS 506.65]|uniref:Uncharacterized protein n=1 Tax=Penicilliopsis zonata CBS 506.65 TaxID=1073090 RepID=A0A1L9SA83_9EURO|nr:hypothetical protein ASPZODRAFT_18801 [Penicilliopsis zonata CBS 506.65]OJJ44027.1 hypothetical protein ASPZODRAFT_18801 [Penicilliopsis zonata CBS 506.65]
MTSGEAKDKSDQSTRRQTEFKDLEIRGTWTGQSDDPVEIKILLEARCVPSSQLQLLDLQSPKIKLIRTSVICVSKGSETGEPETRLPSPASPLFAFSSTGVQNELTPGESGVAGPELNAQKSESVSPEASSRYSLSTGLRISVAKCEENPSLLKRSAKDACLSDVESDPRTEKRSSSKESEPGTTDAPSPAKSPFKQTHSQGRPSLIPVRVNNHRRTETEKPVSVPPPSTPVLSQGSDLFGQDVNTACKDETSPYDVVPANLTNSPYRKNILDRSDRVAAHGDGSDDLSPEEPELVLLDGILLLQCHYLAKPGTYRIGITISCTLDKLKPRGWHELRIPGLPHLKPEESGMFIFLPPERHGLEIRTANLPRYKIVENCFCAEFTDSASFTVPLRVCDKRFYLLKDFTVDQEIRAEYEVSTTADDIQKEKEEERESKRLLVKYNAVCSVRTPNRFFSADKCGLFLHIEGGPDGFFKIRLDPDKTGDDGMQTIRLEKEDRRSIGVSTIRLICSIKDLDRFCIRWEAEMHRDEAGSLHWLPRIYPGVYRLVEHRKLTAETGSGESAERTTDTVVEKDSPGVPLDCIEERHHEERCPEEDRSTAERQCLEESRCLEERCIEERHPEERCSEERYPEEACDTQDGLQDSLVDEVTDSDPSISHTSIESSAKGTRWGVYRILLLLLGIALTGLAYSRRSISQPARTDHPVAPMPRLELQDNVDTILGEFFDIGQCQLHDMPQVEADEMIEIETVPSLPSIRDRIDYLLGWRGDQ